MESKQKVIHWIDNVKILACTLVAVGHLLQGLVAVEIVKSNVFYLWFNSTIYYFHVPLFFICSGYLHQTKNKTTCLRVWGSTVVKKFVAIGIPYFVFSTITWALKTIFSDAVNHQSLGFVQTLFLDPESPYWYLYSLFFIFVVTPVFPDGNNTVLCMFVAVAMKIASIMIGNQIEFFLIQTVLANEIWFVLGMFLCKFDLLSRFISDTWRKRTVIFGVSFLVLSILITAIRQENGYISTMMGLLGCATVILWVINFKPLMNQFIVKLVPFTMPIFLMHTIFAAGLRMVMTKLGCCDLLPHILFGIFISFAGPIMAVKVMKFIKLDILIYPGKYIRF